MRSAAPPGEAADPREVGTAHVLKDGVPAATLTRVEGEVEFAYATAYLEAGGRAVATTLPLSEEPVRTVGGAVPAFFANLLPEGRRLTALRRSVKTSADDELSLLLAIGSDPVGDVQVLPHEHEPVMREAPVVEGGFEEVDFAELLAMQGIGDPSALAGVQDKVSGRMLTVPLAHEGRAHLLKFEVPEFPHVVENEAFFLTVARRLRHPVVEALGRARPARASRAAHHPLRPRLRQWSAAPARGRGRCSGARGPSG